MRFLKISSVGPTLFWDLCRPERGNALGTTLARELDKALVDAESRSAASLVLRAEPVTKGERRTWIAGGDLKELASLDSRDAARVYAATMSRVVDGLTKIPTIVIAAIDGDAIGGGAELALAADLRVMTRQSHLDFKQLEIGLALGYGTTKRLIDLIGLSRAQALLLLSQRVNAVDAHQIGLVQAVADDAPSMAQLVNDWTDRLAKTAPEALLAQKAMFRTAATAHPGAVREAELALFTTAWGNQTHESTLSRWRSQ